MLSKPNAAQKSDIFAGKDRILIFEDGDGDGSFESRKVFIEGLNLVSGIEVPIFADASGRRLMQPHGPAWRMTGAGLRTGWTARSSAWPDLRLGQFRGKLPRRAPGCKSGNLPSRAK